MSIFVLTFFCSIKGKRRFRLIDNNVLIEGLTEDRRRVDNEGFMDFYTSPDVVRQIK